MSDRIEDPQSENAQAVDPPNNTEPEANLSSVDSVDSMDSMDNAPSPVDPPNNT
jgi:hypothetical protein